MLTTDQKGSIAETAIIHAAVKLGIHVLRPVADRHRYDLGFDLGSRFLRVQCKWAVRRGEVVIVRCYSSRRGANGMIRRRYTAQEIDAIAAFCADTGACYFLPLDRFAQRNAVQLRLAPARNNQCVGVNCANECEFQSLDWGAIALGP